MTTKVYKIAHEHSRNNRKELTRGGVCGCFHCLAVFPPAEILRWLREGEGTALCPYCGIDSVIGDGAGVPITQEFLSGMRKEWFE